MSLAPRSLRPSRPQLAVLLLCAVGVVLHQALRWGWFIDDAAITFAYARNLVDGHGLVPWPGGERVEAYSNPTWLLLLAAFQALGLDGFTVAKPLGMLFAVATVPVVWQIAREALPEHRGEGALVAPVLLAMSPQMAIWSASGLENGLFAFLLASAVWATVRALRHGAWSASAMLTLLLVWSRPEGAVYAVVIGTLFAVFDRRPRAVMGWAAVVGLPSLALEAARWAYFAWPLPAAFYAKVEARGSYPFAWHERGWEQLREYAWRLGQVYLLAVQVVAMSGTRGWRVRVAAAGALGLAACLMIDGGAVWQTVRIVAIYAAVGALPALAWGRPGHQARILTWATAAAGVGFAIVANGDWMGAYRWMSLIAPLGSVLIAVGLADLADAVPVRSLRWIVPALGVLVLAGPSYRQTRDHVRHNRNETPQMVALRAEYTRSIARRAFIEEPILRLDPDLGGNLWYAPADQQVDMAMLADVAMGRHSYQQRAFIEDYVFGERRPQFAHVHGWWAKHSGLPTYPAWADYVELPPYTDVGGRAHGGVWGHRQLIVGNPPTGGTRIAFGRGAPEVWLLGVDLPVSTWAPGADGFVVVPVTVAHAAEADGLRLVMFLGDGEHLASWVLPLGYGVLPPSQWRSGEAFRGRHAVRVPDDLPAGTYDLGFAVMREDGEVLPARDHRPPDPWWVDGEARIEAAIRLGDRPALLEDAERTVAEAARLATEGRCDEAADRFVLAKRHRPRDWAWHDQVRAGIAGSMARCLARAAAASPGPEAIAALVRARQWDPTEPGIDVVSGPLADGLMAQGRSADLDGDADTAYAAFRDAVAIEPWRAWARRRAEAARDRRLGLGPFERIGMGGHDELLTPVSEGR